jgi:hypothetical protein
MKDKTANQILAMEIEETFEELANAISEIKDNSFNDQPFPGSWTAGQTAEHIIICGSGIPDRNTEASGRDYNQKVNQLKELFLNFDLKFEAAPSLTPGPGPYDKGDTIGKIRKIKTHLKTIAAKEDLEALCIDMEFPTFGLLTRYEWLSFINFHTKRHTRQIINIALER